MIIGVRNKGKVKDEEAYGIDGMNTPLGVMKSRHLEYTLTK